jgi:Ca-activated chloride channel family protein
MRFASIFHDGIARAGGRAVLACAVVASHAAVLPAQSPPAATYRAGTDLVVLQVAVTDARHRYVPGLRAEDFAVYEDGAPQEIVVFASAAAPLDVMLLIDTSGSMAGRLDVAQRAAIDLLATLREGDRAGLVVFNTTAEFAHPLSEERDQVAAAVRGASAGGATALYEAVYLALRALAQAQPAHVRRQALVVLSDGADNFSHIPFEYVLEAAGAGDVTIFTILLGSPSLPHPLANQRWQDAAARFEMRRLAEDTGGRMFTASSPYELAHVYEQIGNELREQYWLAYVPATMRPGFRRVSVRITHPPGLQARTRTGYDASRRAAAPSQAPRVTP